MVNMVPPSADTVNIVEAFPPLHPYHRRHADTRGKRRGVIRPCLAAG